MSPSIFVPAAIMESELLPDDGVNSSIAFGSLLKIAMCWPLGHERRRIDVDAVMKHFEV